MKKTQVRKIKKAIKKSMPKVSGKKTKTMLGNLRKKVNAISKQSSKSLKSAKKKVYATEEEIVKYVKENPVKSISTVALAALITGFIARYRK